MKKTSIFISVLLTSLLISCTVPTPSSDPVDPEQQGGEGQGDSEGQGGETKVISSISVTPPTKLIYKVGDRALDPAGMAIKAIYSDKSEENISLSNVTVTGFDSSKGDDELEITVSYLGKTASFNISVEYPSPFIKLNTEDDYYLYSEDGGFNVNLGYDKASKYLSVAITDYSLAGDILNSGYQGDITIDTHTVSFSWFEDSYYFNKNDMTLTHDKYLDTFSLKQGEKVYQLSKEEKDIKYFLNPKLVGKWDAVDNDKNVKFIAEITNKDFVPVIKVIDGEKDFTTTLSHDDKGTKATVSGEDSTFIKNGDSLLFNYDEETKVLSVTYKNTKYNLVRHNDYADLEFVKDYFTFANTPTNTNFTGFGFTFQIGNPLGDMRWVKILKNGTKLKEYRCSLLNDNATLAFPGDVEVEGFVSGVKYEISAYKDGEDTVIRLFGSDGTSELLVREAA